MTSTNTIFSPLSHYNYPVLDVECTCPLCSVWRAEREAFDEIKRLTLDHVRSCMCWRCRRRRQLQQSFLASSARRELYCEMSYHAARHPNYGPQLMTWVSRELDECPETDGWWATLAQAYSLSFWFAKFQAAAFPGVSGSALDERRRPQWWCSWCGDDLPKAEIQFCSSECREDHQAFQSAGEPSRKVRLKLSDFVMVYAKAASGSVSWAVSGVAAYAD